MIAQLVFLVLLVAGVGLFARKIATIARNIRLGKDESRTDQPARRLEQMVRVALGQGKMLSRPVAGFFHVVIYAGFVLINLEVLEIVLDGLLGTHRLFKPLLGSFYQVIIGFFEVLAVGVLLSCVVFLWRRNVQKLERFHKPELTGWPFLDANLILIIEVVLMGAFLLMNIAEANMPKHGGYLISRPLGFLLNGVSEGGLHIIERVAWWGHIVGILAFLNYLPYSKHFHILMAFPNTYYADLASSGKIPVMESVRKEVSLMLNPNADPFAAPVEAANGEQPSRFGARDVTDLSWKSLMDAYSCTECGRCSSVCPANITGKKLSPRSIMMKTRDRLEDVGKLLDQGKELGSDGQFLLGDYITAEELQACTTCQACVDACPVLINPLSIITELRRYQSMEAGEQPGEWKSMYTNMENNGAPWQFPAADRLGWAAPAKS
jgi:ferredoxin